MPLEQSLADFEVVHQQVLVVTQRSEGFLHGGEFAPHGAGEPFPEEPTRPTRTVVLPEGVEGFLDREGADGFEIIFKQVAAFETTSGFFGVPDLECLKPRSGAGTSWSLTTSGLGSIRNEAFLSTSL